jgi:hypothetical protein
MMKSAGLWLPGADLVEFVRRQQILGRELERELVVPALRPTDHAYLTRLLPGQWFGRPRIRIPLIAAFGYECGLALHSYVCASEDGRESVARTSAVFNLGIALFDRVCDGAGFAALGGIFNEVMLGRLLCDTGAGTDLNGAAATSENRELRALVAVVIAFFARVRLLAGGADGTKRLKKLLIEAYRAELETVSFRHSEIEAGDLQTAACKKSVLPFEIMLATARLCVDDADGVYVANAERLVQEMGAVFSLVDDLSDLSKDYRSGDANTILIGAGMLPGSRDTTQGPAELEKLLAGGVQEAARSIVRSLITAMELAECRSGALDQRRFRDVLVGYALNWLGAGDWCFDS